jgi:hypothetical protein
MRKAKKKILVPMANEDYEVSAYDLDRPRIGYVLIINNLHTEQKATQTDVKMLDEVFKKVRNP